MADNFTQEQLEEAFTLIEDPANWKNRLWGTIPRSKLEVCEEAAIHFAGTILSVFEVDGDPDSVVVEGAGYYVMIGA